MKQANRLFEQRKQRTRRNIRASNKTNRVRLTVYRSNSHIYAQLIDDVKGETIASVSTLSNELKGSIKTAGNKDAALMVGKAIALKAIDSKITHVIFDKGAYKYHGRIKALADAAREAGLNF